MIGRLHGAWSLPTSFVVPISSGTVGVQGIAAVADPKIVAPYLH
jgi:hypothetical protein